MDELDVVRRAEDANYLHSRKLLAEASALVQEFVGLYAGLGDMIRRRVKGRTLVAVMAAQALMGCRTDLVLGALAALRGHINDSFFYSRRAIEFCAFASAVSREPKLIDIWKDAGRDRPAYNKYLRTFRSEKLFPEGHRFLKDLQSRFDTASKYAHPSPYAFAGRVATDSRDIELSLTFDYFQVGDQDPSEPVRTMLWLLNTHLMVIFVFEEFLGDAPGKDKDAWVKRREAAIALLTQQQKTWAKVIRGG
ncbi:MAG: hypothetical protein FJX46_10700 [Alphaproteobacteria bacterium]|nr:hypothetical protein [Alphaproteobacteria bacterium]